MCLNVETDLIQFLSRYPYQSSLIDVDLDRVSWCTVLLGLKSCEPA